MCIQLMVIVDLARLMIMCSQPMFLLQEVMVEGMFSIMAHQHLLEIHIPMLCQEGRMSLSVRILYSNQVYIIPLDRFGDLGRQGKGLRVQSLLMYW